MNLEPNLNIIKEVHQKLGCMDYQKSRRIISRVLHVFRDQISDEDTDQIIKLLPSNLLIIYFSAWQNKEQKTPTRHLDHYVNRVIAYDHSKDNHVFHTEIEALRATITVLSCLDKQYDILKYLPFCIKQEIVGALITEAA